MNYELKPGRLEIEIDQEFDGKTVLDFLEAYHQSKKNRYLLTQEKKLKLNREVITDLNTELHKGDRLEIKLDSCEVDCEPADKECRVVYEDDFVYVAHKYPGDLVHSPDDPGCLAAKAARYQINHGIEAPVRYIHRLDQETTGLVLFVKVPFFQPWFDAKLEEKEIQRIYLAIASGRGKIGQKYTYNQPIGRDRHVNGRYRFSNTGKEALTKAEIIDKKKDWCLIRCTLETGRTHQIRVHLSGNRHPIVNDPLYGVASADFKHMGLWAQTLIFHHPLTHERIEVHDLPNSDYSKFTF